MGSEQVEVDVVVVGSGAGALTGAHLAARAGLRTLVLEKTDRLGGTSAYSGAAMWLPGTQVQRRADLDDSPEDARTYLRGLLPDTDPARIDAFLDSAPELVATLEEHEDLTFAWQAFPDYVDAPGRHPRGRSIVPEPLDPVRLGDRVELVRPPVHRDRDGRGHPDTPLDGGRALIGRLLLAAEDAGAEIRTGAAVSRLRTDAGGRVVGVEATTSDGVLSVTAHRGVLLAAGGYENDAAWRERTGVPGHADWTMAPEGANTGDLLQAAVDIGAATDLLGEGWFCPALQHADGRVAFLLGVRGGVFVDAEGRRFGNECRPYDQMGRVLADDPDRRVPCWFVFDAREGGGLPAITVPTARPDAQIEAGHWHRADRLDELAGKIGVPGDALLDTVEGFNAAARAGRDEAFSRGEDPYDRFFAPPTDEVPNPCLLPIEQGPFTAARIVLGDLGTKGGLVTDPDARVLRDDGTAVPGLFATSNTVASLSGAVYPGPGIPLGTSMVGAFRAVRALSG